MQVIRKGTLWHQRDKLFSRWKERFFILTQDYFHCFKKDCSQLSDMGEFLFKLRLVNIEELLLLDKRGYLTISLNPKNEGRMYFRLQEGIRDWFHNIQVSLLHSPVETQAYKRALLTPTSQHQHPHSISISFGFKLNKCVH